MAGSSAPADEGDTMSESPDYDPSWGPSYVTEEVWAAMVYIREQAERLASWNRLTNSAPWTTAYRGGGVAG